MVFSSFASGLSFFLWTTFFISVVLGAVVNKTNFCTMGAVSDMVNIRDYNRFRAWLLAIAVATIGVSLLEYGGMIDVTNTFPPYRASRLIYVENILGGILFGIGMTLASGCANKTLIRLGGGNLKSLVVFAGIAVVAYYMTNPFPNSDQTLYSLLFYHWTNPLSKSISTNQDIGAMISSSHVSIARLLAGIAIGLSLLTFIFRSKEFRSSRDNILSGIVIGLVILTAWYTSSNIKVTSDGDQYTLSSYYQEWDMLSDSDVGKPLMGRPLSPQSFTFVNPIGQTLGYIKSDFPSGLLTFGLVSVFGVIAGSFIWALFSRSFRFEWFVSVRDFITHLIGAVLMGFGGVLALGCTIGQGITGLSTLATGSFLAFGAIIFGSTMTMKIQYYKLVYEKEATFYKAFITALVDLKMLPSSMRKLDAV